MYSIQKYVKLYAIKMSPIPELKEANEDTSM